MDYATGLQLQQRLVNLRKDGLIGDVLLLLEHTPVVTLGRLSDCDVVLEDPGASRRHAEIRREDGSYVIIDLGSTNGTMVNGQRVSAVALNPGDMIQLGTTTLTFRVDG